ncbi:MAG: hypothetical protein ACI90E_000797 [Yoonia sp.]
MISDQFSPWCGDSVLSSSARYPKQLPISFATQTVCRKSRMSFAVDLISYASLPSRCPRYLADLSICVLLALWFCACLPILVSSDGTLVPLIFALMADQTHDLT